ATREAASCWPPRPRNFCVLPRRPTRRGHCVNSWRHTAGRFIRGAALLGAALAACATAGAQEKVLRYAFEIAETSFDPHRISDVYSNIVNQSMFEAPLTYDYLAQPVKLKPGVADGMPEISADGTTYTVRI